MDSALRIHTPLKKVSCYKEMNDTSGLTAYGHIVSVEYFIFGASLHQYKQVLPMCQCNPD